LSTDKGAWSNVMTDQPPDTSNSQQGISEWLNATGELAKLVAEEQRPQLIALVLIYIAFLVLIPFSDLSSGIKVLMFVATSVGLLWLAFFVLPKQAKGIQATNTTLTQIKNENEGLRTTKKQLETRVSEAEDSLSHTIAKAHSYLETIAYKISNVKEQTQEEGIKDQLFDVQHYIAVKKREFDSAVARVKSGGQMLETKELAASTMSADFFEIQQETSKNSDYEVSQETTNL
jgi:hypothetical protein